jgi:hypothetical protein
VRLCSEQLIQGRELVERHSLTSNASLNIPRRSHDIVVLSDIRPILHRSLIWHGTMIKAKPVVWSFLAFSPIIESI